MNLPPLPKPFMELHREISPAVYDAWQAQMTAYAAEAVRVALEDAASTLAQALCDDCENGVQWLNIAASEKFSKDYPHLRKAINDLAKQA